MSKAEKKKRGRQAKQERRKQQKRQQLINRVLWIGLPTIFVIGLITFGVIRQANQPPLDVLQNLRPTNLQGNPNAPITIVEFGDFG
ncbi:MAG: hypothetical protein AAGD96_32625 [Chloroflexota bacterium]